MMKTRDFGDNLHRATASVSPQRRDTSRKALQKSALQLGSTGEEVLKHVLADSGEHEAPAEKKRTGFFSSLLSILGLAAPHLK